MSIALDNYSTGSTGWGGAVTQSHTVSGSDRILIAACTLNSSTDKVSGVTYNGIALTRIRAELIAQASTYLYYLLAPATGTHDLVFSFTTSDQAAVCMGASFTGVDQTTPLNADAGYASAYANSPRSLSIATNAGGVAVDIIGSQYAHTFVVAGGQTQIANLNNGGTSYGAMSYKADAASMGWTWTEGEFPAGQSAVSLNAASASGASATVTGTTATPAFSGSAQVSPEASITVTAASPTFSGGASSGTAEATITATTTSPAFSGSATGDTSQGTLTLPVLKNNTGTILANETGATVHVYEVSTGNKVVTKTAQTTNGSGVMSVTDALIVAATQYRVVVVLGSGAEGLDKVTAA